MRQPHAREARAVEVERRLAPPLAPVRDPQAADVDPFRLRVEVLRPRNRRGRRRACHAQHPRRGLCNLGVSLSRLRCRPSGALRDDPVSLEAARLRLQEPARRAAAQRARGHGARAQLARAPGQSAVDAPLRDSGCGASATSSTIASSAASRPREAKRTSSHGASSRKGPRVEHHGDVLVRGLRVAARAPRRDPAIAPRRSRHQPVGRLPITFMASTTSRRSRSSPMASDCVTHDRLMRGAHTRG